MANLSHSPGPSMQTSTPHTIAKGILYTFSLLLLLYVAHIFLYWIAARDLTQLTREIYDHPLVVSNASLKANTNIIKMHRNMKDVVLFDDSQIVETAIAAVDQLEQDTYIQLAEVQQNILGEKGRKLASEALQLFQQWAPIRRSVINNIENGNRQQAARTTRAEGADHVALLEKKMHELTDYARTKATGFMDKTDHVSHSFNRWSAILITTWSLAFLIIAFVTIKRTRSVEKSAEEERQKLQVTIRSIGDGVIVADRKGHVTLLNRVAEQLTGWPEDEARGKNITTVFNIINEITREPAENMIDKVIAADAVVGLANHTLLISRTGVEKPITDSGAPIRDQKGDISGVIIVFRDQTRERAFQKRLQNSERKYRLLSDNSLDVIWTMNLDLEFTFVSKAIAMLTGSSEQEWIGSKLSHHCDEEHYAFIQRAISFERSKGIDANGFIIETEWLRYDGSPLPVEIHGRIIVDDNRQQVAIQGVTRDIRERKKAEEQRIYHINLLEQIGTIAKIGGWEFDPRTGNNTWTAEAARIHDLAADEETNKQKVLGFYDSASRQKIEEAINEAVTLQQPYDLEVPLITQKGNHKWIRTIGVPMVEDGVVVQVRGSFQDITEQKTNETRIAHLNRVLLTIRDINKLVVREGDPENLIQSCCHTLVDNRGYNCAIIILTDADNKPMLWGIAGKGTDHAHLERFREQGKLPECCRRFSSDDDFVVIEELSEICAECTSNADRDNTPGMSVKLIYEDTLYGYLVVSMTEGISIDEEEKALFSELAGDISYALNVIDLQKTSMEAERQQKWLEAQLLQAQRLESIGRLAGGVAHDFNNMLNVILGFSQIALDQVDEDNPIVEDLTEILDAARRAADITRQLLAFARKQTISPKLTDLNKTVEGLLKMLGRLIGEDIDLAWRPNDNLGIIKIDPAQVDQILANLCVNARDSIKGVGKITIETDNVSFDEEYCTTHSGFLPGHYVMLGVSDDGCGMDADTLQYIFEPFYTTKNIGEGTGLGLSTVFGIVKQNAGFINVYSEVGSGTTVKIYLPVVKGKSEYVDLVQDEDLPHGRGETILLVEDETAILRLGAKILTGLGYNVLSGDSPENAFRTAKEHHGTIDLLITDVVMPGMNGRDLAVKIQQLYENVKVLYMSGYTANVIAHQGVLEEGILFMPKPFSKETLANKTREALDQ